MDTNMGSSIFQTGGVNIDNAAQNLEEEEELEEIKRRQEEIQSLLTKAMDDFNYDDQSTVNSSVNESVHEYAQQYKDAGLDNQVEVMYNIRVKEVESLQLKLQAKEQQLADMKAQMVQSLMLTEAENDKLRTSLKNSQELLVDKCNEIQQLNDQIQRILLDNESFKQILKKFELEKAAVDYNNQELREQVAILEKCRGTNPISDAVIQENHHMEISKLQHNLETAFCKNQRLEKENQSLCEQLNHVISEKEDLIANKTEVINKLMQNVDQAQDHNRDLLSSVTRLTAENEKFKTQVQELEANVQMMKGFTDKTEIIKILQKELDKSKHLNTKQTVEFEKLHNEYADLLKEYKAKNVHVQMLEEAIASLERKPGMDSQAMQTSRLMESFSVSDKLRDELENCKVELQQKQLFSQSLQEKIKLLEEDIFNLNKKLELSQQRDSLTQALQAKATRLEEIILNNKRAECETKSTNTDNTLFTPTPSKTCEDFSTISKTQFETELINKEIELRKQLQDEFDSNYESLKQQLTVCEKCSILTQDLEQKQRQIEEIQGKQAQLLETIQTQTVPCEMCDEMSVNLIKHVEIIQQQENQLDLYKMNQEKDKKVIIQLLEDWKMRFEKVEGENKVLKQRLEEAIKSLSRAQTELVLVTKSEEDLIQMVEKKVVAWSQHTVELIKAHNEKIRESKERMDVISLRTNKQVKCYILHHEVLILII